MAQKKIPEERLIELHNRKGWYLEWLLKQCVKPEIAPTEIFTQDAIDFIIDHLHTLLQINKYAGKVLAEDYNGPQKLDRV